MRRRIRNSGIRMKRQMHPEWRIGVLLFALILGLVGCSSFLLHRLESDPRSGAVLRAEDLKNAGMLPGFTPKDHGALMLDAASDVILHNNIHYPLLVTVQARKDRDHDGRIYAYRFRQTRTGAEWELVGACMREAGKNIWYMDADALVNWRNRGHPSLEEPGAGSGSSTIKNQEGGRVARGQAVNSK